MVLIGDTYTEAAQIDLQNVPDRTNAELLLDFRQHSDRVWTIDGLRRSQEQLGWRLLLTNVVGAICLSLVECFAVLPPAARRRSSPARLHRASVRMTRTACKLRARDVAKLIRAKISNLPEDRPSKTHTSVRPASQDAKF
jgi:hypothetical protein